MYIKILCSMSHNFFCRKPLSYVKIQLRPYSVYSITLKKDSNGPIFYVTESVFFSDDLTSYIRKPY